MLIDTHCHINLIIKEKFDTPIEQNDFALVENIIKSAESKGVNRFITIGSSLQESLNCIALAQKFPKIFATIGIHPGDCTKEWSKELSLLASHLHRTPTNIIVGIGECGIDRHDPDHNLQRQLDAFKAHIELALNHQLPLVIHSRDAADETLTCLSSYAKDHIKGVVHCFSEDLSYARDIVKLGFLIGVGGTITYPKNEKLRNVVQNISLESILLETDSPWLPIQSMRGKKNEPQYIADIAEFIAQLHHVHTATVAQITTTNALNLFGLHR